MNRRPNYGDAAKVWTMTSGIVTDIMSPFSCDAYAGILNIRLRSQHQYERVHRLVHRLLILPEISACKTLGKLNFPRVRRVFPVS